MTTLEKIRAEIEQLENVCSKEHGCIAEVLQVIDKYAKQEPCDDAISRQAVLDGIEALKQSPWFNDDTHEAKIIRKEAVETVGDLCVKQLPPVRPQEQTGHCKKCKYFEYDSVAKVDGVPLIVAHEICYKWGDGCKTSEDGYCYLFEPQERSDKE